MSAAVANMSSTPKSSTPMPPTTTVKRSTRVQSPAPRPLEEDIRDKTAAAVAATTSEKAYFAPDKAGLSSSVLASLVAIPLTIFAVMLVAISPAVRAHFAQVITTVVGLWSTVSSPLEHFLKHHSDALVVMGALVAFMPVLAFLAVTAFRATCDLRHFPLWQKVSLGALVSTAMVTLGSFTNVFVAAYGVWAMWFRMPLQKFIDAYAGHIVAASAIVVMAPLGLFVVVTTYRCFTDCGPKNAAESEVVHKVLAK